MSIRRNEPRDILEKIDPYSLVTDLLKNLWAILLGAISVAMMATVVSDMNHVDTYTSSATFAVMSKKGSTYIYTDLNSAIPMAETFTDILNSSVLKEKVCNDIGLASFDAKVTSYVISNTNILVVEVTSDSPHKTFRIITSVIDSFSSLSQYATNAMVINTLRQPNIPTFPNNPFIPEVVAFKGFAYGFVIFTIIFAILSYYHDTIKSENDVSDKLAAPLIGVICQERRKRDTRNDATILVSDISTSFYFVEQFRKIALKLIGEAEKDGSKVILVTSTGEHEGKSTFAANIALTFAKQGKDIILLDGDLRRPSQARFFEKKISHDKALSTMVAQRTHPINTIQMDESGLYLLLEDTGTQKSADIVSSNTFKQYVEKLKGVADFIIIDSPPVSVAVDATILANVADLSVMIVKYNDFTVENINEAIDMLREGKARLVGCVLNGVRSISLSSSTYGYYGYYNYYGRYGKYNRYKDLDEENDILVENNAVFDDGSSEGIKGTDEVFSQYFGKGDEDSTNDDNLHDKGVSADE